MELGVPKKEEEKVEDEKPKLKVRISKFINGLFRLFFIILGIFLITQVIYIFKDFTAGQPDLRMCFDRTMCSTYCAIEQQRQCEDLIPQDVKNNYSFDKLYKYKVNLLEYLNPDQEYCYCGNTEGENRLDTLYQYYWEHI